MMKSTSITRSFGLSTALLTVLSLPAFAQTDGQNCRLVNGVLPQGCKRANAGVVVSMPVGENEETSSANPLQGTGFSISVEGSAIAGAPARKSATRAADVALRDANIQVKYDGLEVKPTLNVATTDLRASYRAGEAVPFRSSLNYPHWVKRAEVRIYDSNNSLVAKVPAAVNGTTNWAMPANGDAEMHYVLRVYDGRGRFDETVPLPLRRTTRAFAPHAKDAAIVAAGEGEDRTATRHIRVRGGVVTVYGDNVPSGAAVTVQGDPVVIDGNGKFVVQRILPAGDSDVAVNIYRGGKLVTGFERPINIPQNDWFYVALADVTIGNINSSDPSVDGTYVDGRGAFYLKGKIKGEYLLTAAADTGEGPLKDIFRNLDEKDARSLLRRLDPDDFYPVYGDGSTITEDAPTSGKFYVRIERGDSHVMWGNFKASLTGSEFLHNERTLYGASAQYRSEAVTSFGENRTEATFYAAQPDTAPQRDVFQGTGGSSYFLKRQDISIGSETVTVLVRDPDTGRILSRRTLRNGLDYDIDYIQGVILLKKPLSSTVGIDGLVRTGVLGDGSVKLVVQYEYTPTVGSLNGYSLGGRVQHWVTDKVRVGATAMREDTGVASQDSRGLDVRVRLGEKSYFAAEYAETQGPGFGFSSSTDGGLTIGNTATAGGAGTGRAYSVRTHLEFSEVITPDVNGDFGAYIEDMTAGFSTLDREIATDQRNWGVYVHYKPNPRLTFGAKYDDFSDAAGKMIRSGEVDVAYQINDVLTAEIGVQRLDKVTPTIAAETGQRTDLAAKLTWTPDEDRTVYVFGQGAISHSGGLTRNNRFGIGGSYQISENLRFSGEISGGNKGTGTEAMLEYAPSADARYYIGYRLDRSRTLAGNSLVGQDNGTLVIGAKRRYNDKLTAQFENNYDMFGARTSMISTYGLTYTPNARWAYTGSVESGIVRDDVNGNFDRTALSFGVAYSDADRMKARLKLEGRWEDGAGLAQDRTTYLLSAGLQYQGNDNWRFLANVDAVHSKSDQTSIRNGDYVEASVGYAYRPVDNDRLNMLFKYTYLYDMPGVDQVAADGTMNGPKQRSHILSIDAIYDLNEQWTIGGKYGFRLAETAARGSNVFTPNTAHLAVLRLDWHVVHNWDAMLEGRVLYTEETSARDTGAALAIYRHFGNNMKVGIGYNYGSASSDLRSFTTHENGVFLNIVAKY